MPDKKPDLLEAAEVILKGGMPGMGYLEEAVTAERERREAWLEVLDVVVSLKLYDPSEKRRKWCPCAKLGDKCWQCRAYDAVAHVRL